MSKIKDKQLVEILRDYIELPTYSGFENISITTKGLFGDYPINIAAVRGRIDELTTLIANGADINTRGEHGYTPLHEAVEQEHIEAVLLLLKHKPNLNIKNNDGLTPIELAQLIKQEKIIELLNHSKKLNK